MAEMLTGRILYKKLVTLGIDSDGYLDSMVLWPAVDALRDKTWTKVHTKRRD